MSDDGARWFLLNASPDVRQQIATLPAPAAPAGRHSPIEGVLLTDAELDHTLGLVLMREARALRVFATPAVLEVLEHGSSLLPIARAFGPVRATPLTADAAPIALTDRGGASTSLTAATFAVPGDPPRFAAGAGTGVTVGLFVTDAGTGGSLAFVPGCGALDDSLLARLARADLVLFDGTFWTDDEMRALGFSDRTARDMGHLPLSGPGGSLARLASLPSRGKVLTHINNTNPVLLEDSPERRAVEAAGLTVGDDGMRFAL